MTGNSKGEEPLSLKDHSSIPVDRCTIIWWCLWQASARVSEMLSHHFKSLPSGMPPSFCLDRHKKIWIHIHREVHCQPFKITDRRKTSFGFVTNLAWRAPSCFGRKSYLKCRFVSLCVNHNSSENIHVNDRNSSRHGTFIHYGRCDTCHLPGQSHRGHMW